MVKSDRQSDASSSSAASPQHTLKKKQTKRRTKTNKKAKHQNPNTKKHIVSSSNGDNEDSDVSDNTSPIQVEQLLHVTGLSLKKKQCGKKEFLLHSYVIRNDKVGKYQ